MLSWGPFTPESGIQATTPLLPVFVHRYQFPCVQRKFVNYFKMEVLENTCHTSFQKRIPKIPHRSSLASDLCGPIFRRKLVTLSKLMDRGSNNLKRFSLEFGDSANVSHLLSKEDLENFSSFESCIRFVWSHFPEKIFLPPLFMPEFSIWSTLPV